MREERTVSPGRSRPRRDFAPDLEGLEQLRLLNAAPASIAVPAPQHASSPALQHASSPAPISVAKEHGTVAVARGGAGFLCGGGGYAPGIAPSTPQQLPGTLLDTAAAFTAAGSQIGISSINGGINLGGSGSSIVNPGGSGSSIVNLSSSGFSSINGAINFNLIAAGFASSGGGYTMTATTPAPYQGVNGNG